jgi:hypothetical protein
MANSISNKQKLMSEKLTLSLHTLPVELVYSILDHLDPFTILVSVRNVCLRLDAITDGYTPYQVIFNCIMFRLSEILYRHSIQ